MTNWIKEPLLHFMLLGGMIFAAFAWFDENDGAGTSGITVSLRQQENLAKTFERTWQRPPSQPELEGLIVDYLRQEIAYRESQRMQLDRDDIVIRRRLRQKLEMLAEDIALLAPPTDVELQEFLDANPERFMLPTVLTIRQIYFNDDEDTAHAERVANDLLGQLTSDASGVDLDSAGDQSMLPPVLESVRATELNSLFGSGFSEAVTELALGGWGGPVRSGYGLHLVRVDERIDGYLPDLEEISSAVQRDWMSVRRTEAIDGLYDRLAENFTITIEASPDALPGAETVP
jgi:hypothetical protein